MIDLRLLALGTRIVVRYRLPDGRATDALGTLSELNDATAVIETKRGLETVALADVLLAKTVPPAAVPLRQRRQSPPLGSPRD